MADYWIADGEGRVLGPVGFQVLSDLLSAGRIGGVTKISRDGKTWSPIETVPELSHLQSGNGAAERHERERADARRLRQQLEAMRVRPAHEIFRVPKDAPIGVYREAFFRMSRKFHPDVVPADAHPELKEACAIAFRFFSGLMTRVESGLQRPTPPPAPAPAPAAEQTPPPAPPPRYDPESFVGIKPLGPGLAQARIRVTRENVGIFADHPLMNLQRGGFFLTDQRVLPLGTVVALTFTFDEPDFTIVAKGKVAWEDAGRGSSRPGFGVTFIDLSTTDREFIQTYVRSARQPKHPAAEHRA